MPSVCHVTERNCFSMPAFPRLPGFLHETTPEFDFQIIPTDFMAVYSLTNFLYKLAQLIENIWIKIP